MKLPSDAGALNSAISPTANNSAAAAINSRAGLSKVAVSPNGRIHPSGLPAPHGNRTSHERPLLVESKRSTNKLRAMACDKAWDSGLGVQSIASDSQRRH
jgi:hypothetical protein